ncbi:sigma-54 interaction domain-containing protein [Anaeroselena agilis]|uniref:Sigma 54-interacting transcriptional regulator n=1 Tax=Anaeroselena agilis TaxID=3063788 RepID=A0ABU3NTU2_9FIRM|nr:sigma 54-interacting transcriptional regulator [Selenomonadales bacterium 4137-cl]
MGKTNRLPKIQNTQVNFFADNEIRSSDILVSYERWQALLQCKQAFLQDESEDPRRHPYMNQEVAASWIRSRNLGVNPYAVVTSPHMKPDELSKLLDQHRQLIDITNSLAKSFQDLLFSCGYLLYLFDKTGVVLLNEGDWQKFPPLFADQSSRMGIVADEHTEGTTAHELCIRLKRPVQLLGPEHYCIAFQNSIASAAPIKDENGSVQAALVLLSQPLQNPPDEETLKNLSMHSFALTTSMAVAIETGIKLSKTADELCSANKQVAALDNHLRSTTDKLIVVHHTLNATMAFVEEGIVAIDRTGKIIFTNRDGMRILKLRHEDVGKRNICEFLNHDSPLLSLAEKGEIVRVEEHISVGNDRQLPFQIVIRPIINHETNELNVAVLKFISAEKAAAKASVKTNGMAVHTFADIITESPELKKTLALAKRFAASAENIMLTGESGTGKELFAQAIHNVHRPQGPFMAVNCAAMPRELIGSELFGYEGGSFTGAERSGKAGKIELAHGGTLFLDEIGDMPLELQAVLLRTLEDKQVMRVGGNRYKKVDFRIIVATNKDLYKMVKESQFREDLYFRLSVLTINIPPLRERSGDIELLVKHFIERYCERHNWKVPQISPAAQKKISEYPWPGNVRQLQNAIIHAVNTAQGDLIKPENLPNYILVDSCPVKPDELSDTSKKIGEILCLEKLEKAAIEAALLHANNCPRTAAEVLGISRSTLYRKLKDFKIDY